MRAFRLVIACLACTSAGLAADAPRLRTLSGKTVQGELISLSDKEIVLKAGDAPVTIPAAEALDLDLLPGAAAPALPAHYKDVELVDGSLLHCSDFVIRSKEVELKLTSGQSLKLPLAVVAYYLNDAQDAKVREEWQALVAKKVNRDLLAIKDENGALNPIDGTFGDGDENGLTIAFETPDGVKRRIKVAPVCGLSFLRKTDPNAPAPLCKVSDTGGDLLLAASVALGDNGFLITTTSGVRIELARSLLSRLDFSKGKLTYLSDIEPLKVVEISAVDRIDHYRRDKSLDDGPIRLDKEIYTKGLSVHAFTELVYDIAGEYKEFRAVLGVDTAVGGDSHVKVTIEGNGRELHSYDVKRKDGKVSVECDGKPLVTPDGKVREGHQSVSADVTNIKLLRITVSSMNLLDLGDQVTLADAKVSK